MEIQTINSSRKIILRDDERYIHVMKYMGSKRELLPDIKKEVDQILKKKGGILDLFAGTGSVGIYLQHDYKIISNDIQSYSKTICTGLMGGVSPLDLSQLRSVSDLLKDNFQINKNELGKRLKRTLDTSNSFLQINKNSWNNSQRLEYIAFCESFPSPLNNFKSQSRELSEFVKEFKKRGASPKAFPYLQTTFLFSETYFSTLQAIDIDSLRYSIENTKKLTERVKQICLTALLYVHSYCSSGTGHFAMYRDLKDINSVNDVFLYRNRDVFDLFLRKINEMIDFLSNIKGGGHQSFSLDYKEILSNNDIAKNYDLIYADPPYSFVHYSRFYHAVESLIKYDYMLPTHKGRYRTDRHQSPFCQKKNVANAFEILFSSARKNDKNILLSYSNTGMISSEEILKMGDLYGYKHKIKSLNYDHSTLGREGHKSNQIREYLISFIK